MKPIRILIGAFSLSLIVLLVMALAPSTATNQSWHAVWVASPKNLTEARRMADAIVLARVGGIANGADIVVPAAHEPNGEDRVPTQRIAFDVVKTLKGNVGSRFTLFKTGTQSKTIEGDPAFTAGEVHLLFLVRREDGTYRILSPEGRYKLDKNVLRATVEDGVAGQLNGMGFDQLEQTVANTTE